MEWKFNLVEEASWLSKGGALVHSITTGWCSHFVIESLSVFQHESVEIPYCFSDDPPTGSPSE
jgi:hypothetical protein